MRKWVESSQQTKSSGLFEHMQRHRIWTILLLLLVLSLSLRFFIWTQLSSSPQLAPDSMSYVGPAHEYLHNFAFWNCQSATGMIRTPGYPLFIAFSTYCGFGLLGVVILQHLMSLGMALAIGLMLRDNNSVGTAILGSGLTATSFIVILYSNFILTEILFAFMILCCFSILRKESTTHTPRLSRIALAGAICGFSVIVRPIGLFLFVPIIFFILYCFRQNKLFSTVIFLVFFSLVPSGWILRNHGCTGSYAISEISNINLLEYQAAGTLAVKNGGDYSQQHERFKNILSYAAHKQHNELSINKKTTKSLYAIYRNMAVHIIRQNPIPFVKHLIRNTVATVLGNGTYYISQMTDLNQTTAGLIAISYTFPATLLAIFGIVNCWKNDQNTAILSLLFIGYFLATTAFGGVGGSRFRIPIEPIINMHVAIGVFAVWKLFKQRS